MTEKILKALRLIDLLADLPGPLLTPIARFSQIRKVRAGETVFCQGESSPYCFGILSGQVTIQRIPKEKGFPPKVLSILGPGAIFGEQSLFEDAKRTAAAMVSQNGELVAIQGKQFREWLEKSTNKSAVPVLIGLLQSSLFRLRQTSHELSLVYGVGRYLAEEKPLKERLREAADFLRASLETVDQITIYQRNPYWDEFEPLVSVPETPDNATIGISHPMVKQVAAVMCPIVIPTEPGTAALVPFQDPQSEQPLAGFLLARGKDNARAFTPNILLLLDTVSHQIAEALIRQKHLDDQLAKTEHDKNRQSFRLES